MDKMLTLEDLQRMEPGAMIATGIALDQEDGLFMENTHRELRWVAVRGGIDDWAIYCHFSEHNIEWIHDYGDKVRDKQMIQKLVPCTEGALARYRY